MVLFICINLLILLGWLLYLTSKGVNPMSIKFLLIGLFYFAQIILSQLFLGILGLLTTPWVAGCNIVFSTVLILCHMRVASILPMLRQTVTDLWDLRLCLGWESKILSILCAIACLWILAAVFLFPPRGVDDLTYHLPRLYEYWQHHRIFLLPVEIHSHFAFPENAEMTFLWPIIFLHTQQWVEGGQLIWGIYGILCLFTLARLLKFSIRNSVFLGFLFFLHPIVLNQMGVNYIDLITVVTFLAAVVCAVRFRQGGETLFLYSSALSIGLAIGMKHTSLLLALYLQMLILPQFRRIKFFHWIIYLSIMALSGGFWYFRNQIILHDAFYPMHLFVRRLNLFETNNAHSVLMGWDFIKSIANKFYLIALRDLWLTTFNGGFGGVFWGIAFPTWIMAIPRTFNSFATQNFLRPFLWGIIPLGLILLFIWPVQELQDVIRISLFIIPFGLIFLGEALILWQRNPFWINGLRGGCVLMSILSFTTVAGSVYPGYRIDIPLRDIWSGSQASEFKYLRYGGWIKPALRWVAEPLDFMTRGKDQGLNCYVATDMAMGMINAYGTRLQNHVWNLRSPSDPTRPEAYIFMDVLGQKTAYYREKIILAEVIRDPSLVMISMTKKTWLLVREDILRKKGRVDSLLRYYEMTFPNEIQIGDHITRGIPREVPLIDTSVLGFGLRYLQLKGRIPNPFYWIPVRDLEEFVKERDWPIVYSIRQPLQGYHSQPLKIVVLHNKRIILWENIRPHENRPK